MVDRGEILTLLRERIVAFAASRVGKDSAEDLAQETLMVLEQKYAAVMAPDELLALAFQILRFKMTAAFRKSSRRGESTAVPVEDLPIADPGRSPEQLAEREELRRRLLAALPRLGERCRELFRLKLLGRSFEDIRRHFGVPSINTIYTWDLRCREDLRAKLGERDRS